MEHRRRELRRDVALLAVAFLALHVPFLGQALVIDDGSFVDQALHLLRDPSAPYSFEVRLGRVLDFFGYFANPPALAYWLAGAARLLGTSDLAFHIACLPFGALTVFATYGLAREVIGSGLYAALLVLVMPAFLMSSHSVMADVPMAGFHTLAVWLYLRGVDSGHTGTLVASGAAAGCAVLLKYSAITILPLMLLYAVLRVRVRLATLAPVAVAAALLGGWCLASLGLYGRVHVFAALELESLGRSGLYVLVQAAAALLGLGGATVFPPVLLAGSVGATFGLSRAAGWCAVIAATAAVAVALPSYDLPILAYDLPHRILGALLLAAGAATVVFVVSAGIDAARRVAQKSPDGGDPLPERSLVLAVWLLGFLAIDVSLLFATPKYLVPALAPLAVLLAGAVRGGRPALSSTLVSAAVVTTTLALALALTSVQASQAAIHRRFVLETVREIAGERPVWFTGHWTIRHYAERAGYGHVPTEPGPGSTPAPGDVVFFVLDAERHTPGALVPRLEPIGDRSVPSSLPLHVANPLVKSGYWAHSYGVLPYVFSRAPRSILRTFRVLDEAPGRSASDRSR